ncbi:hypothetical protein QUG02_27755 [Bacillus hominis]|uniref:Uncharacterized protein n=1 Tax=Bacillus hominis TaxID=2817478 RepID=A0ABT7RFX0_9BACI|nr:hypothetical protein [Bacillus hominis]MDM5441807.1 hypothetical protein [Bacillus hominis]
MVFKLNHIRRSKDHDSQGTLKDRVEKRDFLLSNWNRWIAYITAVWSISYGFMGAYWALGGAGFPIVMALPYAIVRLTWAAGIPLGMSNTAAMMISSQSLAERMVEAVLGGLPICGAILTLGLIQKWGENFPHWFYYLGGKRVPIWFAVIPATCASVLLILAGLKISPIIISKILDGSINTGNWEELGPSLFWLPWGIALGLATISYCQRRRGQCKYCRRL